VLGVSPRRPSIGPSQDLELRSKMEEETKVVRGSLMTVIKSKLQLNSKKV